MTADNKSYQQLYFLHEGRLCHKWSNYLEKYDRVFLRHRGSAVKILEIGVYHGGSLQMLKKYFGPSAELVGVDIDNRCVQYQEQQISIETGDQSNGDFWQDFFKRHGSFDIIIDDGSHHSRHQILTFMMAWPHLKNGGTFLIEDIHCSYWAGYGGGYLNKGSFIEFAKDRVDDMNAFWSKDSNSFKVNQFTHEIDCVSFFDSIVVFEKKIRAARPFPLAVGNFSRPISQEEQAGFTEAFAATEKLRNEVLLDEK